MTIGSKEHYEMIKSFEVMFSEYRLDREDKIDWSRGLIYQSGETNKLFHAFSCGYAAGRINYLN